MTKILSLTLLVGSVAWAQQAQEVPTSRGVPWLGISQGLAAGAAAGDIFSSHNFTARGWGERNGLLSSRGGGFGTKGTLLEGGAVGGALLLQHFLATRHPKLARVFTLGNLGYVGFQGWNITRNLRGGKK